MKDLDLCEYYVHILKQFFSRHPVKLQLPNKSSGAKQSGVPRILLGSALRLGLDTDLGVLRGVCLVDGWEGVLNTGDGTQCGGVEGGRDVSSSARLNGILRGGGGVLATFSAHACCTGVSPAGDTNLTAFIPLNCLRCCGMADSGVEL